MDWSDYFTEQYGECDNAAELDGEGNAASTKIFESIVDLWLEFATFEITLRQFKVSYPSYILVIYKIYFIKNNFYESH